MQVTDDQVVRIAEIEIAPEHLEAYRELLTEEIKASVALEAGVLMLHAVALKERPHSVRLLEVYADTAAYQAHLQTPHFLKYKTGTEGMVTALRLIDVEPIALEAK